MKKNIFFKFFLVAIFATFVSFTACKDYDDDIDNLQEQITSLQSKIDAINESGKVIESVTSTADGVVITLKGGPSYTITNGKDGSIGKDGSVVTIGENGNWFIDGKDTEKPSRGTEGEDGVYYTPGEDGFWHKVDGDTVTPTEDSWIIEGTITAKLEDGYVVLYNVEGSDEPIILGLSKINNLMLKADFVDENDNPLLNFYSLETGGETAPATTLVRYQVSPTNASDKFIDKENLYFKYNNPQVVSRAADLDPKAEFVSLEKGILTVRASVDAKVLEELEGEDKITQLMLVVPSTSGDETVSDWAKVISTPVGEISLVRVPTAEDEDVNWSEFKITETLAEAKELVVTDSAVVNLAYRESLDLLDVINTMISENSPWSDLDIDAYNLEYAFDLNDKEGNKIVYELGDDAVDQQQFISLLESEISTVEIDGPDLRTPIVHVILKSKDSDSKVLEGFIKVNITGVADAPIITPHIYVKDSGVETNNGFSWNTSTTLSKALEIAEEGDHIHIAAGTYIPTNMVTGGDKDGDLTFEINKNITLIGGYPADATDGAVANKANETILSGDKKSYHTVTVTAPVVEGEKVMLKNLSIKDGLAGKGADEGSLAINGVNYNRSFGGGMSIGKSVVDVIDCVISDNESGQHVGGVYVHSDAIATFKGTDIINNKAVTNCGGILNGASTTYLIGCNISDNSAGGVCGGVYNFDKEGGGENPSYLYMYNSTVSGNMLKGTWAGGGGMYLRESSYTQVVNSTFYKNEGGIGGAIRLYAEEGKDSSADVISSTFYNNSAITSGGGIETQPFTTLSVHNSILAGNTAPSGKDVAFTDGTTTTSYIVLGDKVFDKDGNEIDGQTFDHTTMISELGADGTCMITGSSPAASFGMDATLLEALAIDFTPPIENNIITKDQIGNSRSGKKVMGAVVPKITGGGSGDTPSLPPVIW